MKYSYNFRKIHIGNESVLAIDLPEEISLVSTFLFCDVQKSGDWVLTQIDDVLSRKILNCQIEGNVCNLEISADFTIVQDTLSDEPVSCAIETVELRDIVRLWNSEQKTLRNI